MKRVIVIHYMGAPISAISLTAVSPMPREILRAYAKQYDVSEITLSYTFLDVIPMPEAK